MQMKAKEAVKCRILELLRDNHLTVNALADLAGVPPSTIYSMLNEKSKNPGVVSLQKICDGFEISLRTFFDTPLFEGIEQEIE